MASGVPYALLTLVCFGLNDLLFKRAAQHGGGVAVVARVVVHRHAGRPEELEVRSAFPKVYDLEQNYGSLIRGAVRGMLAELDPHSSYLDPEAHQEMQIDTRGEFHGLGIEISKRRDGMIEVVSPIEGTVVDLAVHTLGGVAAGGGARPRSQDHRRAPRRP